MKKILLALTFLAMGPFAYAATNSFLVPSDVNGVSDPGLRSAAVNTAVLVTSTNAALGTDVDGTTLTNGFIYWIAIPSTSTVTDAAGPFVVLRSSNTANLTSTMLIPPIWAAENGVGTGGSQIVNFDPPIPFQNGLSVNIGPAGSTPGTNQPFAVGVRWKRRQ